MTVELFGTMKCNAFRHIFNCCWRESVKPLQYFCQSLPLSYLIDERRLTFFRKLLVGLHDNIVIKTCSLLWVYWSLYWIWYKRSTFLTDVHQESCI